ncbi:hypothetical protein [Streptomyces sp. NPDC049906]|uniref:hypothetical protein n=1 Tax=Streptomyces sp. NPDC049906 TaxID=3155656 RepID=UPI00342C03CB
MKGTRAVLALAVASLLTGCSTSGSQEARETPPAVLPNPEEYRGAPIPMPLDAHQFDLEDERRLEQAIHTVSRTCMESFGLDWPRPRRDPGPSTIESRRYGVTDERFIKKFGYSPPAPANMTWEEIGRSHSKSRERTARIPETTRRIYTGEKTGKHDGRQIPEGGCRGEAYRKMGMDKPEIPYASEINHLRLTAWKQARQSPTVRKAADKWRVCMQDAGYDYRTPEEVIASPHWAGTERKPSWVEMTKPSTEEVDTAVADVRCKKSSLFAESWRAAETENQASARADNGEVLRKAKTAHAEVRRAIREVLAGR